MLDEAVLHQLLHICLLQRMPDDSTSVKELEVTTVREHPLDQSVNIEADCLQSVNQKPTGVVNKLLEAKRRRQQSAGTL
jgi:hypothetical protein